MYPTYRNEIKICRFQNEKNFSFEKTESAFYAF